MAKPSQARNSKRGSEGIACSPGQGEGGRGEARGVRERSTALDEVAARGDAPGRGAAQGGPRPLRQQGPTAPSGGYRAARRSHRRDVRTSRATRGRRAGLAGLRRADAEGLEQGATAAAAPKSERASTPPRAAQAALRSDDDARQAGVDLAKAAGREGQAAGMGAGMFGGAGFRVRALGAHGRVIAALDTRSCGWRLIVAVVYGRWPVLAQGRNKVEATRLFRTSQGKREGGRGMGQDPSQIRNDIEHTRGEMGDTVEARPQGRRARPAKEAISPRRHGQGQGASAAAPAAGEPARPRGGAAAVGFVGVRSLDRVEDEKIGPMADR